MTLGDRVRTYRKAKGLTQEALAKAIGVSKTTITGYELGYREPDVEKIKLLSDALGVTGDDLLNTGFSKTKKPRPCRTRLCAWRGIMINWTTGAVRPCAT